MKKNMYTVLGLMTLVIPAARAEGFWDTVKGLATQENFDKVRSVATPENHEKAVDAALKLAEKDKAKGCKALAVFGRGLSAGLATQAHRDRAANLCCAHWKSVGTNVTDPNAYNGICSAFAFEQTAE